MTSRMTLTAGLAATAATAVAFAAWTLGGGAVARVVTTPLGLTEDPFRITLSGPLWSDRTLRDGDGAPDFAYLTRDEQLTITATGREGARVSAISYRVDGGPVQHLSACSTASCPKSTTVTTLPALRRVGPGSHHVRVEVTGQRAEQAAGKSIEVTVGDRLPRLREGEPVASVAPEAPPAAVVRRTRAIIRRDIRSGVLRGLIGSAAPRFVQIGELRAAGRPLGGTALLALPVALRGVRATVPGYVSAAGGYRPQLISFTAPQLSDLLVDVDLRRGKVIALQPGPRSQTSQWAPQQPLAIPAATDASRRAPALVRLSETGPAFLAYDGARDFTASDRDWPVSLIFAGHASVGRIKDALRSVGFTRSGHTRYLAYRPRSGSPRFDGDRGLKTPCDADGTDAHLRLYAPSATDRFSDPEYGSVVVATAHLDRADGCSMPPTMFGFSEEAERQIAGVVARRLGWRVERNRLALGNAEAFRRDTTDSGHVWWSDGRATLVTVP
jgi:hypothetical protein